MLVWLAVLSPSLCAAQTAAGAHAPVGAAGGLRAAPAAAALRVEVAPQLNGRLDDAAWAQAPAMGEFTQLDPDEGRPASERTDFRIVYDDQAVYVGARLHDRGPITSRLGRRDMTTGASDWFVVSLDSYLDRRTAFRFEVNPSGVRRDAAIGGAGAGGGGGGGGAFGDLAWDAVWDASTSVDAEGWTVEMRIPFSQLRFTTAAEQTWGLQVERTIDRRQEVALFSFTPKSEAGGVPAYGSLTGLQGIRPGRPLELIPYVLSQGNFIDRGGSPFRSDRELQANAGLDARYRITSNLTLTATLNPDFGQVEVDPAVINLSAFETRFEERRPFFVEGSSSFRFGGTVGGPSAAAASLLYTRRLGRTPQIGVRGSQLDVPPATSILGAAKLSGKTANGWSLGVLNAVTGREEARYLDPDGLTQRALVEPRSNYFVGRVNRELRQGRTTIGGILTTLNRDVGGDSAARVLRGGAYTGGLDFVHEWANRGWGLSGFAVASHVEGSQRAIELTQRSANRYFQRPDAESIGLDPFATSMTGMAASVQLRKLAGLHWTSDSWVQVISPAFETNDVGFLQRADRRAFGMGVTYNERRPGKLLRNYRITNYVNYGRNYDGDEIEHFWWQRFTWTHLNYWQAGVNWRIEPERTDDRFTRGGPLAMRPRIFLAGAEVSTDPRKMITGTAELAYEQTPAGSRTRSVQVAASIRTSPRWNLSLGPRYTRAHVDAQYVTAVTDAAMTATFGRRYIFAPLDQTELSLVTRLNYTFTPDMSFELYAQPLIAHGDYGTPMQFQTPRAYEFATFGRDIGSLARDGDSFLVDPDGPAGRAAFRVPDRTFTTRSLRGNAVLRWEFRPGSTFYAVWQQERLNRDLMNHFGFDRAATTLVDTHANNVFVLKWTYWLNP
ncbi:MAG: carbohydrate binding family 9 domain-containing protein [Gemmatimonadetes bacterium]|nr:carbohydrate binding family 9 domain-containing protein [Gemmatimonadota bacterium]